MMKISNIGLAFTFLVVISVQCVHNDEDYIDPVIDLILNGSSKERERPDNLDDESTSTALWKCGNCTDLGTAQLIHSQTNIIDADVDEQDMVDVQISLDVTNMRCVTVNANQPAAVRKVVGSCDGSSVTLDVSPSHNFTILVYT